jgi:nucleoside-diphosphate-sugar epimerase
MNPKAITLPDEWCGEPFSLVHLAWDIQQEKYIAQARQAEAFVRWISRLSEKGLDRIVAAGSAAEYGVRPGVLHPSDPPVLPQTAYGWAKYMSGLFCCAWGIQHDIPVYWLRPFTVYGAGQRGSMVIPYTIACLRAGQTVLLTDGMQQRDFIHVDDVASAFVQAVGAVHKGVHMLNLGHGKAVSVRTVIEHISDRLDGRHLLEWGRRPRRTGEPDVQQADISGTVNVLGWSPRISLEEGLESLLAEISAGK